MLTCPRTLLCIMLVGAGAVLTSPATATDEDPAQECEEHAPLDLSPYAGKVVYLDFWASWCAPCKQSFPWMIDLHKRLSEQGLAIVTVNVDRDRKAADRFLARMESELPVIYDPDGKIATAYQLEAMPSSYLYDRDGKLRGTHLGFRPDKVDEVEGELKTLLIEGAHDAKAD